MPNGKKSARVTFRLEDQDAKRAADVSKKTGLSMAKLARIGFVAVLDSYACHGKIQIPFKLKNGL